MGLIATRALHAAVLLATVVLYVATMPAAQADQLASDIPSDWGHSAAGDAYSLRAPTGTTYRAGQGIDSLVGAFKGPSVDVSSDYGLHSNPLTEWQSRAQYQERAVEVDGRPAKLVTAYAPELVADKPYLIGIHVPEVKRSLLGAIKLTLTAGVASVEQYATIERIFASIRFLKSD